MTQALLYLLAFIAIVFMLGVLAAVLTEDGDNNE